MNDFCHVISPFIRSVLEGSETDYKAIHGAAYATEWSLEEDYKSNHITDCVMTAREIAVSNMKDRLSINDMNGAVDAMRSFWSV
jgi:hypothetical protein